MHIEEMDGQEEHRKVNERGMIERWRAHAHTHTHTCSLCAHSVYWSCPCTVSFVINEIVCIHDQLSSRGGERNLTWVLHVYHVACTAGWSCVWPLWSWAHASAHCVWMSCWRCVAFHCERRIVELKAFWRSAESEYESSPLVQNNTHTHTHTHTHTE